MIQQWARSLLGDARAMVRRWRLSKWEVVGRERFSASPVRLAYFGHDFGFRTVVQKIFAPGYVATRAGNGWLGAPGFPLTPSSRDSDIVAIELDPEHWQSYDTGCGFLLPLWTETNITVADACDRVKKSSSLKEDFRRVRKHEIRCETSRDSANLRTFYEQMYLPYINARHGELSLPDSYETIVDTVKTGELIVARDRDGKLIGGMVLGRHPEYLFARSIGVLSNDRDLLKTGVMSALYMACFERAPGYGFDSVWFGMTGPFLNDGVLRFKKKWGARLVNEFSEGVWLQFNRATPAVESFLINNPFIYRDGKQMRGAAFVANTESVDSDSLHALHASYYMPGMVSLDVRALKPGSNEIAIPATLANDLVWGTRRAIYKGT